jgi:hypothetical protein
MVPQPDIRRQPDGSLDVDFYRRRARRLRVKARREFLAAHAESVAKVFVAAVVIATAIHLAPARDGTGWNGAQAGMTAAGYAAAASTILRR